MQDYIREVEAAVERAAQLTQQLQAYAGTGSGPFAPIDVNAVVADSTNMMQVLVPEGVSLTIALADSLTPTQADAGQLQQVLMNLLKNALDAIGADGGTILVQTEEISMPRKFPDAYVIEDNPRPGRYVAITVKDSGSGIPKSELENIFNPYSSSKGMGRGLGLASVAGIVRSHGGAVAVRSSKDEGTEFTVLLPLAEDDRAAADERVRRNTDAGLTRGPAAPAK